MEDIEQRFFHFWRRIGTYFENEEAFCSQTICRLGQWILRIMNIEKDDHFLNEFEIFIITQ